MITPNVAVDTFIMSQKRFPIYHIILKKMYHCFHKNINVINWAGNRLVWVFQKPQIYWDFHTQPFHISQENIENKSRNREKRQLCGHKCLVDVRGQRRMGRLVRDDRKTTVSQITTKICRIPSLNTQNVEPWNPEADELQQQKSTPSAAPVS